MHLAFIRFMQTVQTGFNELVIKFLFSQLTPKKNLVENLRTYFAVQKKITFTHFSRQVF